MRPLCDHTLCDPSPPNNAIRVLVGNTDTREKDISKIHFYSVAIFKSLWSLKYLRKGVPGTLGILFHTTSLNNHHLSGREKETAAISRRSRKIPCVLMRVKAKSTFSDFATVSAKLSWTELDSPGDVGCRPDVREFTFPLVKRFPLIILSIQPSKQQAAGSSCITRPRPENDVMPPTAGLESVTWWGRPDWMICWDYPKAM